MLDDRVYLTPPDNEAEKVYECYFCDSAIYESEDCYQIDNLIYCEDCINKHFKIIAEKPDIEGYLADLEYHDTEVWFVMIENELEFIKKYFMIEV